MTHPWWSSERGPILRWPLLVLAAGLAIAVGLAAVQVFILTPSEPPQPKVVTDIAGTMRAIEGAETLQVEYWAAHDGWEVRVLTEQPETVRDAVLRMFDGRGYSVVRHDEPTPSGCASDTSGNCIDTGMETASTLSVADDAVVIYWYPTDGEFSPVSVWVPTAKLADDGYPAKQ